MVVFLPDIHHPGFAAVKSHCQSSNVPKSSVYLIMVSPKNMTCSEQRKVKLTKKMGISRYWKSY